MKSLLISICLAACVCGQTPPKDKAKAAPVTQMTNDERGHFLDMLTKFDELAKQQKSIQDRIAKTELGKQLDAVNKDMQKVDADYRSELESTKKKHNADKCQVSRTLYFDCDEQK